MDRKKAMFLGMLLCVVIVAVGFLETSSWKALDQPKPLMAEEATIPVSSEQETEDETVELEQVLVNKEEVDGYIVETYQEHEVVRNKAGEMIDLIPTEHYDYIRYKIDE
ncbi:hypothetical protein [Metabacillus iocasae]|uniref:Uncharacterized protein n=1 Tax=Priestia iocasae TaxID=2291674 RepID=A0ABS2QWU9_9BACI|nr:hypothetical protein [Metabacillus iocasae]MBM7703941.1 hypothetical protein [Metabacillus iocasae]